MYTSRKLRIPSQRTMRGARRGPIITPMKVGPAFRPFRVASKPRCSSSNDTSGAPCPTLRPNTVTEAIAAARLQRRPAVGSVLASVLGIGSALKEAVAHGVA